ncbi:isoprenoid synthase domain-containing protein [Aspergillus karnatakaensis]|uniref:bifunctional terpene synthase/polyprenyl synthetase family protein n=1 Tax=Aspergillus karnatakaensis TaxID=1810916 RepID=UPI003CCD1B6D
MDTLDRYSDHCDLKDVRTYDPPPPEWFSLYPVYLSRHHKISDKASADFLIEWRDALEADNLGQPLPTFAPCQTPLGNYAAWAYCDCLPERMRMVTQFCDWAFFWDDATDSLPMEKNDDITQDLALTLLSHMKLCENHEPKYKINDLAGRFVDAVLEVDSDIGMLEIRSWQAHLKSQSASYHNNMSFEQFKSHRVKEGGVNWAYELGSWANKIRITPEEKATIWHLVEEGSFATILINDYVSFGKEFDAHQAAGTLDRIQNSVALFMREYGYTENEARSIIRSEINKGEQILIDGFEAWYKAPGPKSKELHRYLVMVIQLLGGSTLWFLHAPRYHHELKTTAEDRATLIGKGTKPPRIMEGYPPPKGAKRASSPPEPGTNNKRRSTAKTNNVKSINSVSRTNHVNHVNHEGNHSNGLSVGKEPPMASYSICDAPYEYINSLKSKNMRNKFIDMLNLWLKVPKDSLLVIKDIVQMLHNSSLMLDDIEDVSSLRRGQPATHIFYGTSQTINSANFTYVKTVHETTKLRNPECMEIFIDELSNLHRGQSFDLHWRHHARCPSTDEYIMMVDNKTGGLFRLMLRLMEAEAPNTTPDPSLARLLTLVGRYYQIRDDYLNLTSPDYTSKKGFCEDLDEGKFSLPLIHLLSHTPDPDRITSAIYNRPNPTKTLKREVKTHILDAMESARSLDYVRRVMTYLHAEMMKTFDDVEAKMGTNGGARVLLLGLAL